MSSHYRTKSLNVTGETQERIKEYLLQRQAYTKAQAMHNDLVAASQGPEGE